MPLTERLLRVAVGLAVAATASTVRADLITDGSFESTQQPGPGYYYNPNFNGVWNFNSTSGIIYPPSGFGGPTSAPDGNQYAFLQTNVNDSHAVPANSTGSISQTISVPASGIYSFSVQQAARPGNTPTYQPQVDSVGWGPNQGPTTTSFTPIRYYMYLPSGSHTFSLNSTGPTVNSDNTAFLDQVSLTTPAASPFATRTFTGDADSGISSAKTYTHLLKFNSTGTVNVNGVTFYGDGNPGITNTGSYSLTGVPNTFNGNSTNVTGSSAGLFSSFFYDGNTQETLTINGLVAGKSYIASFYASAFGAAGGRPEYITDSQGNAIVWDENNAGASNGSILTDAYTATGASETFTFLATDATGDSFHQYAFSNEVVTPEPATIGLIGIGLAALSLGRWRRRVSWLAVAR